MQPPLSALPQRLVCKTGMALRCGACQPSSKARRVPIAAVSTGNRTASQAKAVSAVLAVQ